MPLPLVALALQLAPYLIPSAVRALAGDNAAEAAAKVLDIAKQATGADDHENAVNAVIRDPAAQLQLQKMLSDERLEFERLAVKREEIAADDRKSARDRESKVGDATTRNLAYLIVGSFVGMCFAVLYDVAKVDSVLAGTIIGYLSAKAEQVASYYFGSSSSSRSKDETIGRMAGR